MEYILLLLILIVLYLIFVKPHKNFNFHKRYRNKNNNYNSNNNTNNNSNYNGNNTTGYKTNNEPFNENNYENKPLPYTLRPLLTDTEYKFFRYLQVCCDAYHIYVCPKVRMEDFISINTHNKKELFRYRGYIKSRHIDFLLCNSNMKIICAIELDDPSHNTVKANKVDKFKNDVYKTIGLTFFRVKTRIDYSEAVKKIMMYAIPKSNKLE